jgi:hypothetical protein
MQVELAGVGRVRVASPSRGYVCLNAANLIATVSCEPTKISVAYLSKWVRVRPQEHLNAARKTRP